ncbi:unnamed protein product, partial [Phaeothamnion confervicola]
VTPGYHGDGQADDTLAHEAVLVGYPVLVKAVMGGGGKGMRRVASPDDFAAALASCRRESWAAFGDDRVLIEKYIDEPRHVEVQVFADTHGNAVYLHERDCSVQRRHQKVLEEAPAPALDDETRRMLGEAAVRAARAVGYVGAGTVEFLLDTATGRFYFCEMNTRLQVEHPVTEMITGLDLVEWQLRVAAGQPLPLRTQADVPPPRGHAIEARVYAENTARGFLPAAGRLRRLRPPPTAAGDGGRGGGYPTAGYISTNGNGDGCGGGGGKGGLGVRVDTGVREGDAVTLHYDPMIAKLIAWGEDRQQAISRLTAALRRYEVLGVPTNLAFCERAARHPAFLAGGVSTKFLDAHGAAITAPPARPPPPHALALSALALMLIREGRAGAAAETAGLRGMAGAGKCFKHGPWAVEEGPWRIVGEQRVRLILSDASDDGGNTNGGGGAAADAVVTCHRDSSYTVAVDNGYGDYGAWAHHVRGTLDAGGELAAVVDGARRYKLTAVVEAISAVTAATSVVDVTAVAPPTRVSLWNPLGPVDDDDEPRYYYKIAVAEPPATAGAAAGVSAAAAAASAAMRAVAPMPGRVVAVAVAVGVAVRRGQPVVVMEAMKMEHAVTAPADGVVAAVHVAAGAVVDDGTVLIT